MDDQKRGMFKPALVGGAFAGILSAIPFLNCLCCLWIIGGAVLAAFLLAKESTASLTAGDGAVVGALTGISAAVIDSLISLPLRGLNAAVMRRMMERLAEFADEMPSGWNTWLERGSGADYSPALFFLGLFISAVLFTVLGVLGGIIGASLFGKKKGPSAQGAGDAFQSQGDRQP